MQIHLDPGDGVPIYLQIVNQVKYLIDKRCFHTAFVWQ
jgi:hypothetical protein